MRDSVPLGSVTLWRGATIHHHVWATSSSRRIGLGICKLGTAIRGPCRSWPRDQGGARPLEQRGSRNRAYEGDAVGQRPWRVMGDEQIGVRPFPATGTGSNVANSLLGEAL